MTPEEEVQFLRGYVYKLMDQVAILWRLAKKNLDDREADNLDEFFRYHCGLEVSSTKQWIEANVSAMTEKNREKVLVMLMNPRLPTPREELLEEFAKLLLDEEDYPMRKYHVESFRKVLKL